MGRKGIWKFYGDVWEDPASLTSGESPTIEAHIPSSSVGISSALPEEI